MIIDLKLKFINENEEQFEFQFGESYIKKWTDKEEYVIIKLRRSQIKALKKQLQTILQDCIEGEENVL